MAKEEKQAAKAKIVYPEVTEEERPLYANAILVNHTPWDFALHFSHVVTPIAAKPASSGEVEVKAKKVAVISIPATLVRGLLDALQTSLDRYEKVYGKIDIPKEDRQK